MQVKLHRLLLSALSAAALLPLVNGHGVQVRICQTPSGMTRFFTNLLKLHPKVSNTPDGIINGKNIYTEPTGWGCVNDATPTQVGTSCHTNEVNWVYYDYSTTCNRAVQYTLLAGTTVVLQDAACSAGNVYPAATGWFTASDSTPPIPKINGNQLPYSIEVTAENVGDTTAVVTFSATADDDCDSSPSVVLSHASGSSFPIGDTSVTVTATDASGRVTSSVLTITVIRKTGAPTTKPTSAPTKGPTKKPTQSPTKKPTSAPSKGPTKKPTQSPTKKPTSVRNANQTTYKEPLFSAVDFVYAEYAAINCDTTVKTAGSLSTNQDFCSMSSAQLAAFKNASITTIRGLTCSDPNDDSCTAEITSACGSASRRKLSSHRLLQSSTSWQLEYVVINTFTCQTASCSSPSDLSAAVSLSDSVATTMTNSMSSGSFLSLLSTALPETAVGGVGTGKFYPDWENDSGTCLEDGNEPEYMANDETMWLSDSLRRMLSTILSGSGLWYVDPLSNKCVTDCEEGNGETCGGLANVFSDRLYSDPRSCCESELHWRFVEFCEAESFVSSCYGGTGLYYRGDSAGSEVVTQHVAVLSKKLGWCYMIQQKACCSSEYSWIDTELCAARTTLASHGKYWADKSGKCYQDSVVPTTDLSVELYDSIEDCCSFGVPWLSERACLSASGIDMTGSGSNLYYIQKEKCVQDCEGAAPCGGLAEKWNTIYDTEAKCCAQIPWVAKRDCVLA
ncbi:hypothetical protein ACHAWO_012144 [Cyclotella atomus]|uniref:HYR domain-containing protein n=1 Tax=Cyclotella atomus TaxID=382360 RepID=A0ABD3NRW5_9STRA